MTNEEKLQNFRTMTMEAVRKKAADEQAEYQAALDKSFEEYKKLKKEQMSATLNEEREKLRRENNKKISLEQIRLRHEYSQRYEELKGKLKDEVVSKLTEYKKTKAYEDMLSGQIQRAVDFARGEKMIVYIDPQDSDLKDVLEARTDVSLTISEYSFGGGTRAVLPDKNILIDESFQSRINEVMGNISLGGKS